ncbi:Hypothetical predicted protein [Xyrichtys novacula]|uniref:Uncharacterized protein n=1 Tax=Xyrichtys novacula TaxID=13765 RepID=A0AAV1EJC8_XYRNO|nr:Hypothetical predicted protein [Xyrichtys novacula]
MSALHLDQYPDQQIQRNYKKDNENFKNTVTTLTWILLQVYIQEDPGRPHHLLDSELLHTGLQDYTETSMTPSCSRTRLKNEDKRLGPLIGVTTLQADFLSHCEPVDLQPRPENPYSGHGGYSSLD